MNHFPEKLIPLSPHAGHASRQRNTAEACREKAVANLAVAVGMPSGEKRALLERSAAAWSMLAEQLQRQESRLAAQLPTRDSEVDHVRF